MNVVSEILEVMRVEKGIPIVDFVDGVCTKRQYSRYKNGEQEISNINLAKLLDRLDVSYTNFFKKLDYMNNKIKRNLIRQFSLINSQRYEEVYKFLTYLDEDLLVSEIEQNLYKVLLNITEYHLGKSSKEHCKSQLQMLIDYPNCLSKKFLTMSELNAVIYIIQMSDEEELNEEIYHKLLDLNLESEYKWYDSIILKTNLMKEFGKHNKLDELIELYDATIADVTNQVWFKSLTAMVYFRLLTAVKRGEEYENIMTIFASQLELESDEVRSNFFRKDFEKTFGFKIKKI